MLDIIHKIVTNLSLAGLLFLVCLGTDGDSRVNESFLAGKASADWYRLLSAFETHSDESKRMIAKIAGSKSESAERKLARILIDEWDVGRGSINLSSPRPVFVPKAKLNKVKITAAVLPVKVIVNSDGKVVKGELLHKVDDAEIEESILQVVHQSLFRPAFEDGKFVEKAGYITIRLEVF